MAGIAEEVRISRDKKSPWERWRVDYCESGRPVTEVFEGYNGCVLKTVYNREGEILDRVLFRSDKTAKELSEGLANAKGSPVSVEYREKEIEKRCRCGGRLKREDTVPVNAPVVPAYACLSCNARYFNITDEYLAKLIRYNKGLFDDREREELEGSPEEFKSELKDHIIKIYASKHIMKIK
jgi:hypothetical protein